MSACKFVARDQPRVIPNRHEADCSGDCAGCQVCTESHCRICRRAHVEGACAECLAETRESLHEIGRLCNALPAEVRNRGVEGEAMMLLGPSADPEAAGHLEASVLAGRIPADYIDHADNELHPLFLLGTWDMTWRDALEHDEPTERLTVRAAIAYLDQQMTYMAGFEYVPFEDFARDVRRCVGHLEAVLHDGEQHDKGAPCMNCGALLERAWDFAGKGRDGWQCPRCKQSSTEDQYRFAVAHLHREEATHLTDRDMEIRTGVRAGTVREWARRGHVEKRTDSGRVVYAVADVVSRLGA